ncbi:hypothetical protein [Magnetospirillum sp. LM-5]|uniref:hypothetical protein n=1 Tax=Magnetospirillum sp. LM-5 TaxID=2681466 RepID=UPI00156D7339|nr:hypothetical protein [Magnetospirillum sp. LM-5]
MSRSDVVIIGAEQAFAAATRDQLVALGWRVVCLAHDEFEGQLDAVSDETVLIVVLSPSTEGSLAAIRAFRARHGYGPGIIAVADRDLLTKALDAGADSFLTEEDALEILPSAILSVRRMASRWRPLLD